MTKEWLVITLVHKHLRLRKLHTSLICFLTWIASHHGAFLPNCPPQVLISWFFFFIFSYLLPQQLVWMGFLGGSDSKEYTCNAGNLGSIPGSGKSPGGGHGNSLQYSCLENPQGKRSLAGYSPWGHKESDKTEWLGTQHDKNIKVYPKYTK